MTNQQEIRARRVVCSRCGTAFDCTGSASCWCAEEPARLPMPVDGEDCLCRDCLREATEIAEPSTSRGR